MCVAGVVVQWVWYWTCNKEVVDSIPGRATAE